jgi:hypothetical protein
MAFLIGFGAVIGGVALIVFNRRITDFNERMNKAVFGIRMPRRMSRVGTFVGIFVGVWWVVLGLWVLVNSFASFFRFR